MLTREALIRVAHARPELRARLIPIIRKMAHGPVAMKNPDVMLYMVDPEYNNSKFYEMRVVKFGEQTPAKKTQDLSRGNPMYVLERRWGRLTDSPGTGRVDSENDVFSGLDPAMDGMARLRRDKTGKGYTDVTRSQKYPIGLGGAGFGWGGQAACRYVPELRDLLQQVKEMDAALRAFSQVLTRLTQQRSDISGDLDRLYRPLEASISNMVGFLSDELSACR
jgi:predicted DNA-binding WGR domain protein